MPPQRLPIVDSDDGVWGDILRQYLMKEHYNDDTDNAENGGHRNVTIRAGGDANGGAPLKFTSGTLLATPEVGAIEFVGDNLYVTQTSGTTRKKIAIYNDASGTEGDIYYRDGSGYFTRLGIGNADEVLTVSGGLPSWQTPSSSDSATASSSTSLTLDTDSAAYIYTGASAATWTLPAVSGNTGFQLTVRNRGTNDVTIQRAGADTIWKISAITSTILKPEATAVFINDGTYWVYSSVISVADNEFAIISNADSSDYALFDATGLNGMRTLSLPDATTTLVGTDTTQTLTNKTISGSRTDHFNDTSGNNVLNLYGIPSAVNQYYITNQSTGNYPTIGVDGTDANIGIVFAPKGDGPVRIHTSTGEVPTLAAAGVDSNLDLNLLSKNSGVVKANNIEVVTISGAQTLTNKTLTTPIISTISNTGTLTLPTSTDTLVGRATTDTLTNKRVNPRVTSVSNTTSWTINTDSFDVAINTGLTANVTVNATTGTPVDGQRLRISLTGTASRTITWNTASTGGFEANANYALPTTTNGTNRLDTEFIWNAATSRWRYANDMVGVYRSGGTDVSVADGGTGRSTSTTAYGIIAAGTTATGAQQTIAPGTSGHFLKSAGGSALASFAAITAADITGTTAQFNTALTDGDFATLAGNEVLTNKTINLSSNTLSGTTAQFNTALSDGNFAVTDSNNNFSADTFIKGATWTVASGGTTVLTIDSTQVQAFSGSASHTVRLPTTSVISGQSYTIVNATNGGTITVQSSNSDVIYTIPYNGAGVFTAGPDTPVDQGNWVGSVIGAGAVFGVTNTMTFSGTDGTSMTFPSSSDDIVGEAATQTLTNKTLINPAIADDIYDENDNIILGLSPTPDATRWAYITNADDGWHPFINVEGNGTDIDLGFAPKGAGRLYSYQPSGGTTTFLVDGTASNIDFNIDAKGTGVVKANGVDVATVSDTQTLSNKRIQPRSGSVASSATPSINTDSYDVYQITALSTNITSMSTNLTGTPFTGQQLMIVIKDDGSPRTITWGASFSSSGIASLPTTTVANNSHWIGLVWDGANWVCLAADDVGY